MKMYKKICTCGNTWLSDDKKDFECPYRNIIVSGHEAINSTNFSSDDYAELWGAELENENRHSLTYMPNEILSIVKKVTKSEPQTVEIMKELFEKGIGL